MASSKMHPGVLVGIAALVLTIGVISIQSMAKASTEAAWSQLAQAKEAGLTVEALETARDEAKGSDAEPWITLYLALALYDEGSSDDLSRAKEVAQASVDTYPEHSTTPMLRKFLETVSTY